MFFEFYTKRNEKVSINICHILYITPSKLGTIIVDVESNDYETPESYECVMNRLRDLKPLKCDK